MNKTLHCIFLFTIVILMSCSDQKDYSEEFILKEGFKMDALITEPLLTGPVALDFDLKGRIWTVELTGYMRDLDGSEEDYPDGRISFFKDNDKDGSPDE